MYRLLMLMAVVCWSVNLFAQEIVEEQPEPRPAAPVSEEPLVEEDTAVTGEPESPVTEPDVGTPAPEEPVAEPGETEEPAPIELPVKPALPKRPVVDPGLRNMYLGGTAIGANTGARALKRPVKEKPERAWKNEIEVGATGYRGNTDSEFFLLKLKTEKKREQGSVRFSAKGTVGNNNGERDRENAEIEAGMRNRMDGRWYYTAEARYFTDQIADVDYQVITILSPGYEIIQTDDAHLSIELGPAYIAEEKGGIKKDFAAVRLAVLLDKLIDDRILVWERFEYLPAIEDTSVYLVIGEVGVESILTNWFSLRTVLQQRYDSNPAEDKEKQDIFISASLVTSF